VVVWIKQVKSGFQNNGQNIKQFAVEWGQKLKLVHHFDDSDATHWKSAVALQNSEYSGSLEAVWSEFLVKIIKIVLEFKEDDG
jgi:hypothetical protein